MPDPTPASDRPADLLRAAAEKLRTLATAASTDTDGTPTTTWSAKPCWPSDPDGNSDLYGDYLTRDDGRRIAWPSLLHGGSQHRGVSMHTQHAGYIAAMGPGVGLAVADWLDTAAERLGDTEAPLAALLDPSALAVARQLLGTSTSDDTAADHLRRLAGEAAAGVQQTTTSEESDGPALRRYARRMAALDRLCSGRPGYHTVTVKQVLTAMSDADGEQPAAPAAPEEPQ